MKSLSILLLCAAILFSPYALAKEPGCEDFLNLFGVKPGYLIFTGCAKEGAGEAELAARYRLAGTHAAEAEALMMREFDMPPLRFACCGWETTVEDAEKAPSYASPLRVTMHSDETLTDDRARWSEIPFFHIRVAAPADN